MTSARETERCSDDVCTTGDDMRTVIHVSVMNLYERSVVTYNTWSLLITVHLHHADEATHTGPFLRERVEQSCKQSFQLLVFHVLISK
jgi:hypothetical protein